MKISPELKQAFAKAALKCHMAYTTKKSVSVQLAAINATSLGLSAYELGVDAPLPNKVLACAASIGFAAISGRFFWQGFAAVRTCAGYSQKAGSYLVAGGKDSARDVRLVREVADYVRIMTAPYERQGILPEAVEKKINGAMNMAVPAIGRLRVYKQAFGKHLPAYSDEAWNEYPEHRVAEFEFTRKVINSRGEEGTLSLLKAGADTLSDTPRMPRYVPKEEPVEPGDEMVDRMLDVDRLLKPAFPPLPVARMTVEEDEAPPSSSRMSSAMKVR